MILDKNEEPFKFLERVNERCENIFRNYFKYFLGGYVTNVILLSTSSVVVCLMTYGQFDADIVNYPFRFVCEWWINLILVAFDQVTNSNSMHRYSLPWNQKTFAGYVAEICLSVVLVMFYMFFNGFYFLFFISICLNHQAFYQMFQHYLQDFNQSDGETIDKKLLCKLIRFQTTAQE